MEHWRHGAGDHLRVLQRRAAGLGTPWTHAGERRPLDRQDHRSSRMVARIDDHTRRPASPRGRERSEEVFFTTNHAGVPEPPVWLSCVAAVRTGPAVFAARPSGAIRLRGSGIEAGAGANRGTRDWLPGGGVVYTLGRATVAVALTPCPATDSAWCPSRRSPGRGR